MLMDLGDHADGLKFLIRDRFGQDTSLHATRGYDDATGVGSPDALYLYSYRLP